LKFIFTPNTVHPTKEEYPPYYATIYKSDKYKDGALVNLGLGTDLISLYTTYMALKIDKDLATKKSVLDRTTYFGSGLVKGIYVAQKLSRFHSLEGFNNEIDPVKVYLTTDTMQARYFRVLKN
jgi:hypothetical protein